MRVLVTTLQVHAEIARLPVPLQCSCHVLQPNNQCGTLEQVASTFCGINGHAPTAAPRSSHTQASQAPIRDTRHQVLCGPRSCHTQASQPPISTTRHQVLYDPRSSHMCTHRRHNLPITETRQQLLWRALAAATDTKTLDSSVFGSDPCRTQKKHNSDTKCAVPSVAACTCSCRKHRRASRSMPDATVGPLISIALHQVLLPVLAAATDTDTKSQLRDTKRAVAITGRCQGQAHSKICAGHTVTHPNYQISLCSTILLRHQVLLHEFCCCRKHKLQEPCRMLQLVPQTMQLPQQWPR